MNIKDYAKRAKTVGCELKANKTKNGLKIAIINNKDGFDICSTSNWSATYVKKNAKAFSLKTQMFFDEEIRKNFII